MALNIWTEDSGYSLGIIYEKLDTDIPLPVENDAEVKYWVVPNASYSIVALTSISIGVDVIVTATFASEHAFKNNDYAYISGVFPTAYNGVYKVSEVPTPKSIIFIIPNIPNPGAFIKDRSDNPSIATGETRGELPGGLEIIGNHIIGKPYSVTTETVYTFKIRAYKNSNIADRTFSLTILPNNIWTERSGYSFGTINERVQFIASSPPSGDTSKIKVNLPTRNTPGFSYSVISGKLPAGLRIGTNTSGETIFLGTPYEVARLTTFTFCVRASNTYQVSDRTFKMTIDGADPPVIITTGGDSGLLPIGVNQQYFALSNSFVEFQIQAIDYDTAAGQKLSFFIEDGDGILPPGLILTDDGRIIGFVQPILTIKPDDGNGYYDIGYYDTIAYDWGIRPSNGYDSYLFDDLIFDYSVGQQGPKHLNRNYEFWISVTDGDSITKRKFKIFVVSDDYFRADNTVWLNGSGLFTADVTYMQAPIWVTSKDLGTYRANNYITLIIDTYDTENVVYRLELVNSDITAETYRVSISDNSLGSKSVTIKNPTSIPVKGQYFTFDGKFNGGTERLYYINSVSNLGNNKYRLSLANNDAPVEVDIPDGIKFFIGSKSELPPGMKFDVLTAEVIGSVPYQPAITTSYSFTITATRLNIKPEKAESSRTFTIRLIGEIDSVIKWISDSHLGTLNANFISTLSVKAESTINNAILMYSVISGQLPPGLHLELDGEIVGKVNQYPIPSLDILGIITFDREQNISTTFDNGATTFDHDYKFTVEVKDQYGLSELVQEFTISIETPNELIFSNLRVKPFLKINQRAIWKEFINNPQIFTPASIYRPNDPNFGIQKDLSMIVYAGIETKEVASFIGAIGLNHKKKRFQFGPVKQATAVIPGTKDAVYEVVYIEMIDPLEINGKSLAPRITHSKNPNPIRVDKNNEIWKPGFVHDQQYQDKVNELGQDGRANRPDPIMTIDSNGYIISDPNVRTYYPNSVTNWRYRIKQSGETERNYLPLWMRSIQPGTKQELDFQLAIPLCYCKVGTASDIILNIKFSEFDFGILDYTIDRYIIDSVQGSTQDKYLVFKNDRITV